VKTCRERIAVLGTGGVEDGWNPEKEKQEYVDYFAPIAMVPMPEVFAIPVECPEDVAAELRASFALIWSDRNGAAGRLRVAVERLLTAVGIKWTLPDGRILSHPLPMRHPKLTRAGAPRKSAAVAASAVVKR
jgi:hypothetical protein